MTATSTPPAHVGEVPIDRFEDPTPFEARPPAEGPRPPSLRPMGVAFVVVGSLGIAGSGTALIYSAHLVNTADLAPWALAPSVVGLIVGIVLAGVGFHFL